MYNESDILFLTLLVICVCFISIMLIIKARKNNKKTYDEDDISSTVATSIAVGSLTDPSMGIATAMAMSSSKKNSTLHKPAKKSVVPLPNKPTPPPPPPKRKVPVTNRRGGITIIHHNHYYENESPGLDIAAVATGQLIGEVISHVVEETVTGHGGTFGGGGSSGSWESESSSSSSSYSSSSDYSSSCDSSSSSDCGCSCGGD